MIKNAPPPPPPPPNTGHRLGWGGDAPPPPPDRGRPGDPPLPRWLEWLAAKVVNGITRGFTIWFLTDFTHRFGFWVLLCVLSFLIGWAVS